MKYILLIIFLFSLSSCDGQKKMTIKTKDKAQNSIKKDTMKQIILDKYKDWELDTNYSSTDNHKFYKKLNDRVEITIYDDAITETKKSIIEPYVFVMSFYPNNIIKYSGKDFYSTHIEIWKKYDEAGKLIEETNYETPFKFTIKELIEKIKKEYHVNLGDKSQGGNVGRNGENGNFYYEVELASKENPQMINYILIDGVTGETKFKTHYYMKGNATPPFDQYLETLKKK